MFLPSNMAVMTSHENHIFVPFTLCVMCSGTALSKSGRRDKIKIRIIVLARNVKKESERNKRNEAKRKEMEEKKKREKQKNE